MQALSTFFSSNMIFVFFIYGLAFFVMGLAVALEARRSSSLVLSSSLPFLAVFALLHSFVEWIDMFILIESHSPGLTWDTSTLRVIKVVMFAVSTACLIQFGAELVVRMYRSYHWLRWLAVSLFVVWALNTILFPHYSPLASNTTLVITDACLRCHAPDVRLDLMSREWVSGADVSVRYFLYLPGSILAALAIAVQGRLFARRGGLARVSRDCYFAAVGFLLNAFFGGLVVPPVAYFPSWLLNYNSFFTVIGIPPQVFRAACALAIAFFIVRVLRVFEIENWRQLEAANDQRFAAQQEALEVQRRARAEIEELNRDLERRVEERTRELQQRNKEAEALYTVGTEISALLDIGKILNSVVEKATQLLGTEAALLSLKDEKSGEIFIQATSGCHTEALKQLRLQADRGINGRVVATSQPVRVCDYQTDEGFSHEKDLDQIVLQEGLRGCLGVPVRMGDETFGALVVADRSPRKFGDSQEYLLLRLANQAAIAIVNARLYAEIQNLAVLEERYRIAREMHDGVAQVLGFLNLKVKTLLGLVAKPDLDQARADLDEMGQVIQSAYADVRESILSLRTPILPGKGFFPTLSEFLQGFSQQSRVNVCLEIKDEETISFSEAVQLQLVRIIQEALSNVRKHARATNAWISFAKDGDSAEVTVADDGQGFDPASVPHDNRQHLGLQTMRERAESIGGNLSVVAAPGKGAKVVVRIPLNREGVTQNGTTANSLGR